MLLPRNSNLAMHQDAAIPNTRFNGTAMTAVSKVSLIADTASGSVIAARYACQPFLNASANTDSSGTNRNRVRNASAIPISSARTQNGSSVAAGTVAGSLRVCGMAGKGADKGASQVGAVVAGISGFHGLAARAGPGL